jgi:hypothetical protein
MIRLRAAVEFSGTPQGNCHVHILHCSFLRRCLTSEVGVASRRTPSGMKKDVTIQVECCDMHTSCTKVNMPVMTHFLLRRCLMCEQLAVCDSVNFSCCQINVCFSSVRGTRRRPYWCNVDDGRDGLNALPFAFSYSFLITQFCIAMVLKIKLCSSAGLAVC